ncbi:MAG: queuosine salvage family protein [Micavibrio sp.]
MYQPRDLETLLRAAPSKGVFLDTCRQRRTPDVIIEYASLRAYAATLKPLPSADIWGAYLGRNRLLKTDFKELAVSTVQQGGYLYEESGAVKCWSVGKDEIRALLDKVDSARDQHLLPGVQQKNPRRVIRDLGDHFADAPFAAARLDLWAELAEPDNQRKLSAVFERAKKGTGKDRRYHFDFASLKGLAEALPKGLGDDPFLKKASLLCILFAGVAAAKKRPVPVTLDLIVPADWRDPQTLHNAGALRYSDALVERLNAGALLAENDPFVTQIRAATVVAGHDILNYRRDLTLQDVDGALWLAGRLFDGPASGLSPADAEARAALEAIGKRSPFSAKGFQQIATRAMNVSTMRF